jgi:hypothetical protein
LKEPFSANPKFAKQIRALAAIPRFCDHRTNKAMQVSSMSSLEMASAIAEAKFFSRTKGASEDADYSIRKLTWCLPLVKCSPILDIAFSPAPMKRRSLMNLIYG